jgi:hypothetical protein
MINRYSNKPRPLERTSCGPVRLLAIAALQAFEEAEEPFGLFIEVRTG